MKPSNNMENKTPSGTYWRVQLLCKKVQTHSSLESLMEYKIWFNFSKMVREFS